ncbi:MAG: TrpR YerC/YecD [Lachnospiraceae bacterium]|jgi:TrpR-related protein YerC/YecD|nr:TrpR YerC/YecD [Lachnospiraceae bacterium]
MSKKIESPEMDRLMEGILCLESKEEAYQFFEDLCTINEMESLCQRFEVAGMLRQDETYQEIVEKTGASTATISRVKRALNYGTDGYDLIINRLEEND